MPDPTTTTADPTVTTTLDPNPATTTTLDQKVQSLLNRLAGLPPDGEEQQAIVEHHVQLVSVTIAELKAAIAANPGHPLAADFLTGVTSLADTQQVAVEQPSLMALIHNRPLITDLHIVEGRKIQTKRLG